jgi:hypothetical protein
MIMGANIGTTVTNTLAALGNIRRPNEFRPGFAAATLHDYFKLMSVAILLPLELATNVLTTMSVWLTERLRGTEVSEVGSSPIRTAVKVPVDVIEDWSTRSRCRPSCWPSCSCWSVSGRSSPPSGCSPRTCVSWWPGASSRP